MDSQICLWLTFLVVSLYVGCSFSDVYSLILNNILLIKDFSMLLVEISVGGMILLASFCFTAQIWPLLKAHWNALMHGLPWLPPGSMGLPYWGETLEYMSSWVHATNPDQWYDRRHAKYGNVFKTFLLGSPTVVMLGPDANKFVLSNENKLFENSWPRSLRELEGEHAVSMVQGEAHKRLRRAINVFLNAHALKTFGHRIEAVVVRRIKEDWIDADHGVVLGHPALQKLAFQLNAELFMGLKPGAELERLHAHYEDFTAGLESQPLDLPWTVFGKAKRARRVLLDYMFTKISKRRRELGQLKACAAAENEARDLLDLLLMSRDEETGNLYTAEEIGDNMILMVHAGQDTTASALAVTLNHLAQSPKILSKLKLECRAVADSIRESGQQYVSREELKGINLLNCVISEGLRMCPPVSGFFKRAKCDVVYQGFTIPKGWTVHLSTRHTHLKAEFFSDPEVFDPSRFERRCGNFSYIPFGQGARICPGMEFAKITMELFLFHLLSSFEELQLMDPHEKTIIRTFSPYPEQGLPIKLTPRMH